MHRSTCMYREHPACEYTHSCTWFQGLCMSTPPALRLHGPKPLAGCKRLHLWGQVLRRLLDTMLSEGISNVLLSSPGRTTGPIPQGSDTQRGQAPASSPFPLFSQLPQKWREEPAHRKLCAASCSDIQNLI